MEICWETSGASSIPPLIQHPLSRFTSGSQATHTALPSFASTAPTGSRSTNHRTSSTTCPTPAPSGPSCRLPPSPSAPASPSP